MNEFYTLVIIIMLFGILCYSILKSYATQVYRLVTLAVGIAIGLTTRYIHNYRKYTKSLLASNPRYLLSLFFVCNVFHIAQSLDYHILRRCWIQIILISTFSFLICAVGTGIFICLILIGLRMNDFSLIIMFGAALVLIETHELINRLQGIAFTKHLETVVNGEKVFTEAFAMVIFNVCISVYSNHLDTPAEISSYFIKNLFGGIFIGLGFGLLIRIILRTTQRSLFFILMLFITTSLASYYSTTTLKMNGALSIMTVGIFASIEKRSMNSEDEEMMHNFFRVLLQLVNTLMYTTQGILLTEKIIVGISGRDIATIFISLAAIYTFRLVTIFLMAPLLSRIEYGLSVQEATVISLGVTRGGTATFLGWILMYQNDPKVADLGIELYCITCSLQILTCILESCVTPLILKFVGLSTISLARRNNMNTCIKHINIKTEQFISVLKMDKFLADSKWQIVAEVTKLRNPYTKISRTEKEYEIDIKTPKYIICPDCLREVPHEPTTKELADMTREARLRILKAKRVSYIRQHENGMLTSDAFRCLNHAVDRAMDAKDAILKLDELFKMFRITQKKVKKVKKKTRLAWLKDSQREVKIPKQRCRRNIYNIVLHPYFGFAVYVFVLLTCGLIIYETIAGIETSTTIWYVIMTSYFVFYMVYIFEFIIKSIAYTTSTNVREGMKIYFSSFWNVFDLCVLILVIINLGMDICEVVHSCKMKSYLQNTFKVLRLLLLVRIVMISSVIYEKISDFREFRKNKKIMLAYEIGKGYLIGNEGIEEMIMKTIDNEHIRDDCKQRLITNSHVVSRQLGLIEKEKPWITNMVKTKHACLMVINDVRNTAFELKISGWMDEIEYSFMKAKLDHQFHTLTKMKLIPPNTPKEIFNGTPWIAGDDALIEYLFSNIITKIFDVGEEICTSGFPSDGVFILVSGLLRLTYIPKPSVIDKMNYFGVLPVVDWVKNITYKETYEEYITPGNSFGEISVVTGYPYSCTITAETPVQTYVISRENLKIGFSQFSDPINGLEARMWKAIAIRVAPKVLMNEFVYQSYTEHQIQFYLVDAIVPNITNYKIMRLSPIIEDIVVLHGVAQDYYTGEYFIAPCYVPRSVQYLILPNSSQYTFHYEVPTKIVMIPGKNIADPYDIFSETYALSDVNYSSSMNVLLQEKTKAYKKRKLTINSGRRKNYGDVETKTSISKSPTLISENTLKTSSLNIIFDEDKEGSSPVPTPQKGNKKSPRFDNDSTQEQQ